MSKGISRSLFAIQLLVVGISIASAQVPQSIDGLRAQGARVTTGGPAGTPVRFVGFDAATLAAHSVDSIMADQPARITAVAHVNSYGALFGLRNVAEEAQIKKHVEASDGRTMTRFQQFHLGIPVIGGELIVNQTAKRQLSSIGGRISPDINLSTSATIVADHAKATALAAVAKWHKVPVHRLQATSPVLSVYDSRLISPYKEPLKLVWHLEVTPLDILPIREVVLVNAATGAITLHFNQNAHARNRNTYDSNSTDPDAVAPTLVCNESNQTCAGIADAVKAHRYAGNTYDYYFSKFARDSIDNLGMSLKSTVRICPADEPCPYENAYWWNGAMFYGQGFADGEDVVAHELTHGVTEYESGLFYYYQSGAINESLSDVFGEIVQQSNASEPVSSENRWLIGENLSIGVIRSMSNPTLYGDPDKMTSANYSLTGTDNGGVHTNSGVNNKAAYLMVDGGTFNGKTVTPIGMQKAGLIYYRVQTSFLTSGSDYLDLYDGLYQACQDMIGVSGITAQDCTQVRNATLAVEMNLDPSPGFMPSAKMCPTGKVVQTTLFSDGFEGGMSQWLLGRNSGTTDWGITIGYAASGIRALYGWNPASVSDFSVYNKNAILVPPNAFLWFKHAFEFEHWIGSPSEYYDGGVLEFSTNGGLNWTDASSLYAEGQNYGGLVDSGVGNPLATRNAFVGASHGYVSSRYNLSSLSGQAVQFRWRVGTDSSVESLGWLVDEVSIHTCVVGPRRSNLSALLMLLLD